MTDTAIDRFATSRAAHAGAFHAGQGVAHGPLRRVRRRRHEAAKGGSILGSPVERFERYDRDVRREYAFVPQPLYRRKRAEVLQRFLDRPRLYHGAAAVALLEDAARRNLAAALARLAP